MSKIKLNVLGKCPYCGAPNTKKINETEYLCNHCGQTRLIEKELNTYDSSNLNLKDIIVKSNSNTQSELEKTVSYLIKINRFVGLKLFKLSKICFSIICLLMSSNTVSVKILSLICFWISFIVSGG